ncbi:MAG: hypothetical protein KDK76_03205 [Chlamydiia bacterium]|nr:hypothetical protein [Chlamydiia bacterium]
MDLIVIRRGDFDCCCGESFIDLNDPIPAVMIEGCGEYMHKECLEAMVIGQFQAYILSYLSNVGSSFSEFRSAGGRYLTPKRHFTLDEVVYNHNIQAQWDRLGMADEYQLEGYKGYYHAFAPESLKEEFRKPAEALSIEDIERALGDERRPVYGQESWGLMQWGYFLVRLIYHVTVATIIEIGMQLSGTRESHKEFREANVSHRLTPLFEEYHGMTYNPPLKETFETKTWNWLCGRSAG